MSDYCYDIDGNPMTLDEWAEARKGDDSMWKTAQRKTPVEGCGAEVSTVWLGTDHQYGDGPPLIFESMVFGGGLDQHQVRYSTLAEAHAGHDELIEHVKEEAAAFAAIAADDAVAEAVRLIEARLDAHRTAFDIGDYDHTLYGRLVEASHV